MADSSESQELTHKQEKFVLAFIGEARGNATKAAIMAGYSEKSARRIGYELHKTPQIRVRIKDYLETYAASAEHVLAEITDIAMSEWRDHIEVLEWSKDGKPLRVRMDLSSKVKSLELLGKHHQLFTDNVAVSGGIAIEIAGVDVEQI